MTESRRIGSEREGRVCVAAFEPPDAVAAYDAWKVAHDADFGSPDDWIVNVGRAAGGGDFVEVWVPRSAL